MMEKDGYPVKYAVIQVMGEDSRELFEPPIYIAAKCYVLGKMENICCDGSHYIRYRVCHPFVISALKVKGRYHTKGFISNSISKEVDFLYDSFEEAKEEAFMRNNSDFVLNFYMDYYADSHKALEEHKRVLEMCDVLEQRLECESIDLMVSDITWGDKVLRYARRPRV